MTTRTKSIGLVVGMVLVVGAVLTAQTLTYRIPGKLIVESTDAATALNVKGGIFQEGSTFTMQNANPLAKWKETGASANEGCWRMIADGDAFSLQTCDDAESAFVNVWTIGRTATVPSVTYYSIAEANVDASASSTVGGVNFDNGAARITGGTSFLEINIAGGTTEFSLTSSSATYRTSLLAQLNGVPMVADRTTTDGTLISLRQDATEEGTIAVAGTTVSYNAFMGSHYTQTMPGQASPEPGTVVVSTGRVIPSRVAGTEKFVYVRPSRERNARATYGVWFASLGKTAAGMSWGDPTAEVFQVAGLGLAQVLVTDTCGPIRRGDLIASSPREGLAERQCHPSGARYDPLVRDTTLGKALVDVEWSTVPPGPDGVRKVLVPAVLYAG